MLDLAIIQLPNLDIEAIVSVKELVSADVVVLTSLVPSMEISSRPSLPQTTQARSHPPSRRASAKVFPSPQLCTPMTQRLGRAGLMSGPSTLKMVGKPSDLRIRANGASVGWYSWAKRKVNGELGRSRGSVEGVRLDSVMSSAANRSAEPEVEEEARAPCFNRGPSQQIGNTASACWLTLHTRTPGTPAATMAAVVETLKVS